MILYELKERTQLLHEQLENLVRPRLGFDGSAPTRNSYRVLVELFWGFYSPLENSLWSQGWDFEGFDRKVRQKSPLLQSDLKALGLSAMLQKDLPLCEDLPLVEHRPQALGCLYVLEGATLGGQIIARHLQASLGITAGNGGAFFSSYGENIGPMWQSFRVLISSQISSDEDTRLAVEAAQQTFKKFHHWLAQEVSA